MVRKLSLALASAAMVAAPTAALASSRGYTLRATVGVHCSVQHQFAGYGEQSGDGISLGELRELCNAQNGYEVVVSYTPGTLRGTVLRAGSDTVVLNGSGEAVLSQARGPRILKRTISATPGERGFDTDAIQFRMVVS